MQVTVIHLVKMVVSVSVLDFVFAQVTGMALDVNQVKLLIYIYTVDKNCNS